MSTEVGEIRNLGPDGVEYIAAIFDECGVDKMSSQEIITALAEMEGRPWPEWGKSSCSSGLEGAHVLSGVSVPPPSGRPRGFRGSADLLASSS
jgi:hypothetical protein